MKKIKLINVGFMRENFLTENQIAGTPSAMDTSKEDSMIETPRVHSDQIPYLIDIIKQINEVREDFRDISSKLPKDKWELIGKDCDVVWQHLDNAAGRISTIIHSIRR